MPRVKILCEVDHQPYSDADCLACAKCHGLREDRYSGESRHCKFNYPMMAALLAPQEERVGAGVSATMLTTLCMRQSVWKLTKDFAVYPSQMWAALDGTFVHAGLEQYNEENVIAEVRLFKRLPSGAAISGKMDRYIRDRATIEDYKTKEYDKLGSVALSHEYEAQLNIYGWMLRTGCTIKETGEIVQGPVEHLILYPLAHKEVGTPHHCRVWSDAFVVKYIEDRVQHYLAAEADQEYVAPRHFRDPRSSNFCTGWCPFVDRCVEAGGPEEE